MIAEKNIHISDFDYELPKERIAYYPVNQRDKSKLLVNKDGQITDACFSDLPDYLDSSYRLIFNDSKVIHARLLVHNANGAAIEIFCLEPVQSTPVVGEAFLLTRRAVWKCLIGNVKRWKDDISFVVDFPDKSMTVTASRSEMQGDSFEVTFRWDDDTVTFGDWVEQYGKMPLPPYIKRAAEKEDEQRYQTIYARYDGSVAAPTAGLHFSNDVIAALNQKGIATDYVTLHVGAGTFKPVSCECIGEHYMHKEQIVIYKSLLDSILNSPDKKIVAVGTTVARTLESMFIIGAKLFLKRPNPWSVAQWEIYEDEALQKVTAEQSLSSLKKALEAEACDSRIADTSLMITPHYERKLTKAIITNFHQPKSTLLLLISSFLGEHWHEVYKHALDHEYRFLSYGDSNLYL